MREQCVDAAGVQTVTQRALGKKRKKAMLGVKKAQLPEHTAMCLPHNPGHG